MRTVGEILSEARKKKKLSLDQVEKETKIRKRILYLLETGKWEKLSPTYIKGLLKNYASFLELDENNILAFFRREYDERKAAPTAKKLEQVKSRFRFTPTLVTAFLIGLLVISVFTYLFFQYRNFTAAPRLEIYEPKDNTKISSYEVNVVGKTWNDATLKINGEKVQVSSGGTFSVAVSLKTGVNKLTITSANQFGKISTKTRTVVVDGAEKPGTDTTKENISLQLKVPKKSVILQVVVDGRTVFDGLMLAGSSKNFEGKEKIKIISENAGETWIEFDSEEFVLGEKGEKVERDFTISD
jgi:cytoskeletal protein RodZ